jgi:hypothetical protein
MNTEKTVMPSSWAGVEVKSGVSRGPLPRLQPYDVTAPSEEDLEKIRQLILERKSLPNGPLKRRQQLTIANRIFHLRHPDFKEDPQNVSAAQKKWITNNPERRKKVALDYYYRTRPPLKTRVLVMTPRATYFRNYRKTSIQFALKDRLRASINRALRRNWVKKSNRTMQLVGCSVEELKAHLEVHFVEGMCWENRSTWHVDHLVPLAAFNLRDSEEQLWAFNWRNLQPLYGHENHSKSDSIPSPLPSWLPAHIAARIIARSPRFLQ